MSDSGIKDDRLFYTAGEMASRCGVHPKTWRVWVRKGIAPSPILVNGAPKWLASDIEKWLKKLRDKRDRR